MELCASASLTGVLIMSHNFHLIDNHGNKNPYKHPHHHRSAVRTHLFDMASKRFDQNSSLYVLTAVIKKHLHIKNWKIEGVWFVSVMGYLWGKKWKINIFPTAFNQESRFWFLWGIFSLGSVIHIFTQGFLKVTISQFFKFFIWWKCALPHHCQGL